MEGYDLNFNKNNFYYITKKSNLSDLSPYKLVSLNIF